MNTYRIPYTYKVCGYIVVKAESMEEAKEIALDEAGENKQNEHYVDDSFDIVDEFCEEVRKSKID